jgi:hypothetical protein
MTTAAAPSESSQASPAAVGPDAAHAPHGSAAGTTEAPDVPTSAARPPVSPRPNGRWRALSTWSTLSAALVTLQIVGTSLVVARGYFYQDDFLFISRAVTNPLVSREVLLEHWSGHFMPAGMAASWLLAHAAPFAYGPVIALLATMQAAAAIIFRMLARGLFGAGRAHVLAVLIYATSMPVLTAASWWAAAVNVVPMQIAMFVAASQLTRRPRTRRHRIAAVVAVAVGLLCFEKGVLIPFVLFGLVWTQQRDPGWWSSLRCTWREERGLWRVLAGVLAGYALAYMVTSGGSTSAGLPLPRTIADTLSRALVTVSTSLLGGPLDWVISFEALAMPPLWLVIAALQLLALGTMATLALSGRKAGRWLVLGAATFPVGLLLLLVGRPDGAALLAGAPRYFADLVPVAALAIAGALAGGRQAVPAPSSGLGAWLRDRRGAFGLLAVANVVILLAVASSGGVIAWLAANPSRGYVTTTVNALRELSEPTVILDTAVPAFVLGPLVAPENHQSNVFSLVGEHAEYREQTTELTIVPPGGGVVAGTLDSPSSTANLPGPEPQCGWRVAADVAVPLQRAVEGTALRLGYIATAGGTVDVGVGDAPPTRLSIEPGLHKVFLAVQGTGSSVSFSHLSDGVQLCTDEVTFGVPAPSLAGPAP